MESEVKGNYERDKIPDPLQYYVKDYPYYSTAYYPELAIIEPRYTRLVFKTPSSSSSSTDLEESPIIYIDVICAIFRLIAKMN